MNRRRLPPLPPSKRLTLSIATGALLGLLAGGADVIVLSSNIKLYMGHLDALLLFLACIVVYGLAGTLSGGAAGLILLPFKRLKWGVQAGITAALLTLLFTLIITILPLLHRFPSAGPPPLILATYGATLLAFSIMAALFTNWVVRRGRRGVMRFGPLPPAAVVLVLIFILAHHLLLHRISGRGNGISGAGGIPVILIVIDTLRADHCGPYAGELGRTPGMDSLAPEGTVFLNTIAPEPETGPSHSSIFTGLHPLTHGVISNFMSLGEGFTTLAEVFKKEGYRTAGFVSAYSLDSTLGLAQGFDIYDDAFFPRVKGLLRVSLMAILQRTVISLGLPPAPFLLERGAEATEFWVERWLDTLKGGRPFFLFLHYFDPHSPYFTHRLEGFEENWEGRWKGLDHIPLLQNLKHIYTEEEKRGLESLYAEEVAYSDKHLGRFLKGLKERGLFDESLIVFTSDHGESLTEHGIYFSHLGIYDVTMKVPLIVKLPASMERRVEVVERQVSLLDLFPTILDVVGIERGGMNFEGRSLFPILKGDEEGGSLPADSLLIVGRMGRFGLSLIKGIRTPSYKYILKPSGDEELYDLAEDPLEVSNIALSEPGVASVFKEALDKVSLGSEGEIIEKGADRERREKLKALGYVE